MIFLYDKKLPDNKNFSYSLTVIFGLGKKSSQKICKKLGFCLNLKILSKSQVLKLNKILVKVDFLFANQLRKFQDQTFNDKLNIKLLKSFRLMQGLPIRGQRTHTNGKTARKKI